jgi:hypothetical protein
MREKSSGHRHQRREERHARWRVSGSFCLDSFRSFIPKERYGQVVLVQVLTALAMI